MTVVVTTCKFHCSYHHSGNCNGGGHNFTSTCKFHKVKVVISMKVVVTTCIFHCSYHHNFTLLLTKCLFVFLNFPPLTAEKTKISVSCSSWVKQCIHELFWQAVKLFSRREYYLSSVEENVLTGIMLISEPNKSFSVCMHWMYTHTGLNVYTVPLWRPQCIHPLLLCVLAGNSKIEMGT